MIFTNQLIKDYHTSTLMRHGYWKDTCSSYNDFKIHYYDNVDNTLISERRPGESEEVQKYREKIKVEITQDILWGVIGELNKIRKAKDYDIQFPKDLPARLNDNSPEDYLMYEFPFYTSVTNWAFSTLLTQYCLDANAVVLTMPDITKKVTATEYLAPYPTIYNSDQIIDYKSGEFYLLKSKEVIFYEEDKSTGYKQKGSVYYTVTTTEVNRWEQVDYAGNFTMTATYKHNLNRLPVTNIYGVIIEDNGMHLLCKSRLSPMIPRLKEIYREYSDVQAEVVQHIHSTMWAYQQQECKDCKGQGTILAPSAKDDKKAVKVKCKKCKGMGFLAINPFEHFSIKMPEPGGVNPPSPPAGYIQKDTEIIKVQDQRINDHRYLCLASVHMENTSKVPLNQSGVAKEWDQEGQNNFIHAVAEDIARITDNICVDVIDQRYPFLTPAARYELYPEMIVPDKFDLVGSNEMLDDLKKMKEAGVDSALINAAEMDYASKAFISNKEVRDRLMLKIDLDPLRGLSSDDILTAGDDISPQDKYAHWNIGWLVDELMEQNKGFADMPIQQKKDLLDKLVEQEMQENSVVKVPQQPQPPMPPDNTNDNNNDNNQ